MATPAPASFVAEGTTAASDAAVSVVKGASFVGFWGPAACADAAWPDKAETFASPAKKPTGPTSELAVPTTMPVDSGTLPTNAAAMAAAAVLGASVTLS